MLCAKTLEALPLGLTVADNTPPAIVTAPESTPRLASLEKETGPPLMVVPREQVFVPPSSRVPAPFQIRLPVPLITPPTVPKFAECRTTRGEVNLAKITPEVAGLSLAHGFVRDREWARFSLPSCFTSA